MGGRHSLNKGKQYERDIANKFKAIGFTDAKRLFENREGMGYDVQDCGPFKIQCKAYAKYAPISKLEEAPNGAGDIPLLVTKGDRKQDVVCMYLTDFMEIIQDVGVAWEGVVHQEDDNE